jgi:hypothetical protein
LLVSHGEGFRIEGKWRMENGKERTGENKRRMANGKRKR